MDKHTPGPWNVGKVDPPSKHGDWDDAGGYRIDADGVEQLCYVWNASQRMPLSGLQADGPPFGSDSGEANARLIAAAPDLLSALTVLADACESMGIPVDAARAAIAKATSP